MSKFFTIMNLCFLVIACTSASVPKPSDESRYVKQVWKLLSPDGKFALYKYWVQYPETRYGYVSFTIKADTAKFNPSPDYFAFSDTLDGYNILGWKEDTIKTLCIISDENPPLRLMPYKVETTAFKKWYWQKNYYHVNAFSADTEKYFDSVSYSHDTVMFSGNDSSRGGIKPFKISALKGQVLIPLGDTLVRVTRLESLTTIDPKYNKGDSIRNPPVVGLKSYKLKPNHKIDWNKLKMFGVFVEQEYHR